MGPAAATGNGSILKELCSVNASEGKGERLVVAAGANVQVLLIDL